MTKCMEKENSSGQMANTTKDTMKKTKGTGKGLWSGTSIVDIEGFGRLEWGMDTESQYK